ncbi:MAG TPA: hypothetical protein DEP85_03615 [Holosporales bacterium]|nr:hypothetical protein [Holosporales bacterium]
MEAYKNLITNISLFVLIGAIPSLGWATGIMLPFSLSTLFLFVAAFCAVLCCKSRSNSHFFKKVLLSRGDAWAISDGDKITDCSPSFPATTIPQLKEYFDPINANKLSAALHQLFHQKTPFQFRLNAAKSDAIYLFEGEPIEDRFILWLKNITDQVHQEKLSQDLLKNREEQLQSLHFILNSIPVLVWQRNEHQKITFCNASYANALQTTPEKIYEDSLEFIQPRFAKVLARKAIHTGELQSFESSAIVEGQKRYFRIYEAVHPNKTGCTIGLAHNITELNDVRMEVKRLIKAHDEVLAHLSTAISVHDGEGILQYYNQAYVTLYSFDEEFLKTNPRLDEVLEELRSRRQLPEFADFPAYKRQRLMQLKEQIEPLEGLMHLPDERTLRTFSAPHPMGGLLFMSEDVTDYLSLERKNKTFLDAYQATLDNLFEGVIVFGSHSRLKIFNPSFLRLWNFDVNDVKSGQHLTTIIDKLKDFFDYDEDWEGFKSKFLEEITDRVPKTGQLKRKDGMIINYRYVPLPIRDHLLSYTDATDTLRIKHIQKEQKQAIETAEKLKSAFITNISSELRSPLNTIVSFTDILSQQYFGPLNKRQIDYVEGITTNSEKLLGLVNDILDLASLEAGYISMEHRPTNVPSLLKSLVTFFDETVEQNKQYLVVKCHKLVEEWPLDEKRVKQILLNLIANAIKFTPTGGAITVEAHLNNETLEICVSDSGVGIPPEEQEFIFNDFEEVPDREKAKTVIGLSLVKKLVELHGGDLELESELEKGTKITCIFPKPEQSLVEKDKAREVS